LADYSLLSDRLSAQPTRGDAAGGAAAAKTARTVKQPPGRSAIVRCVTRPPTQADYAQRVLRVLVHVQHHLDGALDLDALAAIACFSPFHFHRVFKGMVGESVKQHVRRLRLERAAQRLKWSDEPVVTIAFEAGYETHEAFTRAFRAAFGRSPSEFRAASDPSLRIEAPSRVHYVAADAAMAFVPIDQEKHEMDVEIRTLAPLRVAFIRHVGPYDQVGRTWERLTDWVGGHCLFGPETRFLAACWDDPEVTPPDKIRYDACVSMSEPVQPSGEVGVQQLGDGRYAVALHEGPYTTLSHSYETLLAGIFARNGLEPGDPPSLEFYLNDPDSTEPEDLLTEIWMPIRD
jgi:AraC family transcriptional regulator